MRKSPASAIRNPLLFLIAVAVLLAAWALKLGSVGDDLQTYRALVGPTTSLVRSPAWERRIAAPALLADVLAFFLVVALPLASLARASARGWWANGGTGAGLGEVRTVARITSYLHHEINNPQHQVAAKWHPRYVAADPGPVPFENMVPIGAVEPIRAVRRSALVARFDELAADLQAVRQQEADRHREFFREPPPEEVDIVGVLFEVFCSPRIADFDLRLDQGDGDQPRLPDLSFTATSARTGDQTHVRARFVVEPAEFDLRSTDRISVLCQAPSGFLLTAVTEPIRNAFAAAVRAAGARGGSQPAGPDVEVRVYIGGGGESAWLYVINRGAIPYSMFDLYDWYQRVGDPVSTKGDHGTRHRGIYTCFLLEVAGLWDCSVTPDGAGGTVFRARFDGRSVKEAAKQ